MSLGFIFKYLPIAESLTTCFFVVFHLLLHIINAHFNYMFIFFLKLNMYKLQCVFNK